MRTAHKSTTEQNNRLFSSLLFYVPVGGAVRKGGLRLPTQEPASVLRREHRARGAQGLERLHPRGYVQVARGKAGNLAAVAAALGIAPVPVLGRAAGVAVVEERGHAEVDQGRDATLIFELLFGRYRERTSEEDVGEGGRCEGEQEQEKEQGCRGGWRRHEIGTCTGGVVGPSWRPRAAEVAAEPLPRERKER